MKPEAYYPIHKSSPLVPNRKINPSPYPPTLPPNINFNIIILSMPKSSKWSLSFRYLEQNCVCALVFYMYITMTAAGLGSADCSYAL
jgi:hypothetical protein